MKKLLLLLIIPLLFSCNTTGSYIDQWEVYENGVKKGELTLRADYTVTADYGDDNVALSNWKVEGNTETEWFCLKGDEWLCGSVNWESSDQFSVNWAPKHIAEKWITIFKR